MYARSLVSNAGWSKKTQSPSYRSVTGGGVAAQVSVGDQGLPGSTKPAASSTGFNAEIQQGKRVRGQERDELHGKLHGGWR